MASGVNSRAERYHPEGLTWILLEITQPIDAFEPSQVFFEALQRNGFVFDTEDGEGLFPFAAIYPEDEEKIYKIDDLMNPELRRFVWLIHEGMSPQLIKLLLPPDGPKRIALNSFFGDNTRDVIAQAIDASRLAPRESFYRRMWLAELDVFEGLTSDEQDRHPLDPTVLYDAVVQDMARVLEEHPDLRP